MRKNAAILFLFAVCCLSAHATNRQGTNAATPARQVIAPLLTTQWGQKGIYAKQCFTPTGRQAASTATATALAQVMNYYRSPRVMDQPVPAYTANGKVFGEWPPAVFEWERMRDAYRDGATEEQKAAVAQLIGYAGRAAKTDFGAAKSTTDFANCVEAINGCFGYANNAVLVSRDECGVEEWEKIIYHELSQGRPVLYSATDARGNQCTVVCDGYDGYGRYHINWGLEGTYDGYYRLNALHPAACVSATNVGNDGYSMRQQAIIGISPVAVDDYGVPTGTAPSATWSDLTVKGVEQLTGNNVKKTVRVMVENHGTADFAGPMRLQVDDIDCCIENLYVAAGSTDYIDFYFNGTESSHRLKVIDDASSQVLYDNEEFYLEEAHEQQPTIVSYSVLSTDVSTMLQHGKCFEMEMTLCNDGATEYFGQVEAKLYRVDGSQGVFVFANVTTRTVDVAIAAGATCQVHLTVDNLLVGEQFYYNIKAAGTSFKEGDMDNLFTVVDGYAYWDVEGACRYAPLDEQTQVPEGAVAVDFSGCDLSAVSIVANGNPNTLYYIGADTDVPTALFDSNVVMGGEAVGDISFADGYGCHVPRAFHVEGEVAYTRTITKGGFADGGWQTIALPFAVAKVKANGRAIDWQHGHDGRNYDCWLRSLTHISADTAYFEAADRWRPNVPYLFAVPDGQWGETFDLTNMPLRFSATNTRVERTATAVTSLPEALYEGNTGASIAQTAWVLNDEGTAFARTDDAVAQPFGCWMRECQAGSLNYDVLHIASHSTLPGDVNNDGIVSVVDVMMLVDFISGNTPLSLPLVAGDIAKDAQLSVADVMAVVGMIMN